MAEIHLTAMGHGLGGPSFPTRHHASIGHKPWPGGGTVPVLVLNIGQDLIEIWPFEPEFIEQLGHKLIALALQESSRRNG